MEKEWRISHIPMSMCSSVFRFAVWFFLWRATNGVFRRIHGRACFDVSPICVCVYIYVHVGLCYMRCGCEALRVNLVRWLASQPLAPWPPCVGLKDFPIYKYSVSLLMLVYRMEESEVWAAFKLAMYKLWASKWCQTPPCLPRGVLCRASCAQCLMRLNSNLSVWLVF